MHVAQISFFRDPLRRSGSQMLLDWPSLADTAEAVAGAGHRVSVVQAATRADRISRNGVDYRFLEESASLPIARRKRFAAVISDLAPEVLHVHGFAFPHDVMALARSAPTVPIILQDHAGAMPRFWRRPAWRRGFAAAAGIAFTGVAQSERFRAHGMLDGAELFDIPESSSHFRPGDRAAARTATGLFGDPCLLWVGRLNPNKDPLALLSGISRAARSLPRLALWCAYGDAPMLAVVKREIERDPALRARVHLLGAVSHPRIEHMMRAADFFVSASRSEGSGYALIEAMACGLPAIVTDIPAFRALTGDGKAGWLWPCGEPEQFAQALERASLQPRAELRESVRAHFDREVSFAAVGRKWSHAYRRVIEMRHARH